MTSFPRRHLDSLGNLPQEILGEPNILYFYIYKNIFTLYMQWYWWYEVFKNTRRTAINSLTPGDYLRQWGLDAIKKMYLINWLRMCFWNMCDLL